MLDLSLTRHGAVRLGQRGIPPQLVELLLDYGCVQRRFGADVYALDKRGRRRLRRDLGDVLYRQLHGLLNTYAVVADDGALITAGRRVRRLAG